MRDFNLQQGRRHHQKLAGDIQVQLLHHAQVFQILVGDKSNGDVGNRDPVLPHEVEQQV
jgi:hypothetical protein